MKNRISVGRLRAREQVKVYGLAELEEKMKDLAPRVHQKIFKRAVRPSLEGMMAAAKINVMAVPVLHPEHKVRKAIAGKIQIRMKGAVGSRYKTIGSLAVFYGKSATGRATRRGCCDAVDLVQVRAAHTSLISRAPYGDVTCVSLTPFQNGVTH